MAKINAIVSKAGLVSNVKFQFVPFHVIRSEATAQHLTRVHVTLVGPMLCVKLVSVICPVLFSVNFKPVL